MARTLWSSKVNAKSCSWDRAILCWRTAWGRCLGGSFAEAVLEDKVAVRQWRVPVAKPDPMPAACADSRARGRICPCRSTGGTPPGCRARFRLPRTRGGRETAEGGGSLPGRVRGG